MSKMFKEKMHRELKLYGEAVAKAVEAEIEKAAKEAEKELKGTSPKRRENGGAYAKSWTSEKVSMPMYRSRAMVYNKKHYRLTHLLEKGHATRSGGKTAAQPHIKPVEEKIIKELPKRIDRIIKGGL